MKPIWAAVLMPALWAGGCVSQTSYERGAAERMSQSPATLLSRVQYGKRMGDKSMGDAATVPVDGSLEGYVAYAMRENPGLRAAVEDWRAAVHAIAERRRLPDPVVSWGVFLRRVETRVGPQRQRFGLRQMFPWPGKRRAAADAAADMARAAEHQLGGQALGIIRRVADGYWQMWAIQRTREIEKAQRDLLAELAVAIRTRIEVGKGGLADAAQVDLEISRRDDALAALDAQETRARAMLRQAIGAPPGMDLPISAELPLTVVPAEPDDALRQAARENPRVTALESMALSRDHSARAARAQRMPDLTLSLDYIETGAALMDNVPDSGKDPIMVMAAVNVPIWGHTYDEAERKARAEAAALRARRDDAVNQAEAELDAALAEVCDSARRIELYRNTLIPQAETAYAAVVGTFQTGSLSLANVLMAQKALLDLQNQLVQARAAHARGWARLVDVAGRPVAARPWDSTGKETP